MLNTCEEDDEAELVEEGRRCAYKCKAKAAHMHVVTS